MYLNMNLLQFYALIFLAFETLGNKNIYGSFIKDY